MLAETVVPLCRACRDVTVRCKKCSATAQTEVRKSLQAFSMERLQQWKKNRDLTAKAVCLRCDPQEHAQQRPTRQQNLYTCMACHRELQPKRFDAGVLRRAEENEELHALECKACAAPAHGAAHQQPAAAECIHCKKMEAIVDMTQDRNRKWVCWQCSYPACSGCGERCPAENIWRGLTSSSKVCWAGTDRFGFASIWYLRV